MAHSLQRHQQQEIIFSPPALHYHVTTNRLHIYHKGCLIEDGHVFCCCFFSPSFSKFVFLSYLVVIYFRLTFWPSISW